MQLLKEQLNLSKKYLNPCMSLFYMVKTFYRVWNKSNYWRAKWQIFFSIDHLTDPDSGEWYYVVQLKIMALGSYWSFIILPRLCWKHEEAAVYLAQACNEGGIWEIFIKGTKSSQHTVCWSSWQKDSHPETQGENSTKEHYFTFSIKYVLFFHVWGTCITLFLLIYLWQDGTFFSQLIKLIPFVLLSFIILTHVYGV